MYDCSFEKKKNNDSERNKSEVAQFILLNIVDILLKPNFSMLLTNISSVLTQHKYY
jgi:hypothetical protein